MIAPVLAQLLHFALVLTVAPLVIGVVRKLRARFMGRLGPPILQPYRDMIRLARKAPVAAAAASPLFLALPFVGFGAVWLASGLVPTFSTDLALTRDADLIVVVGLLAAARMATALGGLDVGTAFGGIGASRDLMIGALAEPAMLMVILSVALVAGSTGVPALAHAVLEGRVQIEVSLALALIALVMVALAENGRIPIDNPSTHLELTMIHEAMVLEYAGPHLALVEATRQVKLVLHLALIAVLFLPWGIATTHAPLALALGLGAFLVKLFGLAAALALLEITVAKMRIFRVGEFLGAALLLALLAAIFRLIAEARA